jgi:nucleoid-associated protein YgaU
MPRLAHGAVPSLDLLRTIQTELARRSQDLPLAFAAATPADVQDFDLLFSSLQNDAANLLPESVDTVRQLKDLGRTMQDPGPGDPKTDPGDADIPAAYTYFGQFVDHDVTFEVQPADLPPAQSASIAVLLDENMAPLSLEHIRNAIRNFRTATLDLDSLYGLPAPRDPVNGGKLQVGTVSPLNGTAKPVLRPPGKGDDNDLPREPRSEDILHDRAALIGDPRNDENLVVAQLHVAFLKAHNALADQGRTFTEARRILRQHYQHIIIQDFLKRIADPTIVDDIVEHGNRWYDALAEPFFLPLEFAVAAYRFGHTMVRDGYDFNLNFNTSGEPGTVPATLDLLFTFTALSGQVGFDTTDTLPDNWIIEWENFVEIDGKTRNLARKLDTKLAAGLFQLHNLRGDIEAPDDAARLAVRNLLRGYRLRLPTGQAIAGLLGLPVLKPDEIEAAAASPEQAQVLRDAGFLERTPLWYYLLAEAKGGGGQRLGPVGSTIVAEVLIGLVRRSDDSILRLPGWMPSLPSAEPGRFELADLLRFAGVLPATAPPIRTHTVAPGETLSGIAAAELGDADRWPEIFVLNRGSIRDPDRIFAGEVLTLPGPTPSQQPPRIYVVQVGDTLSGIAAAQLGDANRWPEIFKANQAVISNPDRIVPGLVLVLPAA